MAYYGNVLRPMIQTRRFIGTIPWDRNYSCTSGTIVVFLVLHKSAHVPIARFEKMQRPYLQPPLNT